MMKNGRFYIAYGGADMEVTMIGEGDRKLAMIAYLLMNGSLSENGYLAALACVARVRRAFARLHPRALASLRLLGGLGPLLSGRS